MTDLTSSRYDGTMERTADGGVIRFELESVETGCVLRLSHVVTDPRVAIDNCYIVGLHTSLSRLEPCLAGRPTAWDWDAFAESQAQYASAGLAPPLRAE